MFWGERYRGKDRGVPMWYREWGLGYRGTDRGVPMWYREWGLGYRGTDRGVPMWYREWVGVERLIRVVRIEGFQSGGHVSNRFLWNIEVFYYFQGLE